MKTYASVSDFEAAKAAGGLEIEHVVGQVGGAFYFLGSVLSTDDYVIRVTP